MLESPKIKNLKFNLLAALTLQTNEKQINIFFCEIVQNYLLFSSDSARYILTKMTLESYEYVHSKKKTAGVSGFLISAIQTSSLALIYLFS